MQCELFRRGAIRGLMLCSLIAFATVRSQDAFADATSTLVVTITPQRAIDDGAKWRYLENGNPSRWYPSGYKVTGLPDGDVSIEGGRPQNGSPCNPPSHEIVEIRPNRPHMRELDYMSKSCR